MATTRSDPADRRAQPRPPALRTTARRIALVLATIAVGLMAGFFYAYHVSVIRGLALLSDPGYVEAMSSINAMVRNAQFGLAFFGAVPLGLAALAISLSRPEGWSRLLVVLGVGLYLVTFVITFTVNVPLNRELADGVRAATDAAVLRATYEAPWNTANAWRTATNLLAFAALAWAAAVDNVKR